jgi:hypothetical protein
LAQVVLLGKRADGLAQCAEGRQKGIPKGQVCLVDFFDRLKRSGYIGYLTFVIKTCVRCEKGCGLVMGRLGSRNGCREFIQRGLYRGSIQTLPGGPIDQPLYPLDDGRYPVQELCLVSKTFLLQIKNPLQTSANKRPSSQTGIIGRTSSMDGCSRWNSPALPAESFGKTEQLLSWDPPEFS